MNQEQRHQSQQKGVTKDTHCVESHDVLNIPLAYLRHLKPIEIPPHENINLRSCDIHPSVLRVAVQMQERMLVGSNRRTTAMLTAFRRLLEDYKPPRMGNIPHHLRLIISKHIVFFRDSRPHNLAMGNAIKWLKETQLKENIESGDISQGIERIANEIAHFITERILLATEAIVERTAQNIIEENDVILVFGRSTAVNQSLIQAFVMGKRFRVVVVDSAPLHEGLATVELLLSKGMVKYVTATSLVGLAYHVRGATKIILGAVALTANGNVFNRAGSSIVGLMGRNQGKKVYVLCESYKFSERVLIDCTSINELEDPSSIHVAPEHLRASNRTFTQYEDTWPKWMHPGDSYLQNAYRHDGVARPTSGMARTLLDINKSGASIQDISSGVSPLYDVTPAHVIASVVSELGTITVPNLPSVIRDYDSWRRGRRV